MIQCTSTEQRSGNSRECLRRQRCAFTLAEIVVVVLIMGILAAVAVPKYFDAESRYQVDMAAGQIKRDLEFAREFARKQSVAKTVTFNVSTESYVMTAVPDPDHPSQNYTSYLNRPPFAADLVSANCGGDAILIFSGFGVPDSAASISVAFGNRTRTIAVDAVSGEVKVQ